MEVIKNRLLIVSTVIATAIYLVWRIFYTIPFEYGIASIISGISLLTIEIIGMAEAAIHFNSMSNMQYPKRPQVDEKLFPDVDIFIATYNEPKELLYKTINGCNNMDYPDKSKVHIYLCDDGNRAEMRELAQEMNINYLTRTDRKGAKAGNLNNGLANSKSPLIVTFDADMIPMHGFLTACVPYFMTEEKIGFVQTPQSFYNPDLFQYYLFSEGRIPNEQNYFYRDVQISRNKTNSVIYGGSNTIISRKALEDAGGFYTNAITEDFATGMIIQSKGYKCYAIDEIHASGLSPSDLISLVKQRQRWARGCIQTARRLNILFRKGLNFKQKLSYISAITYWYSPIKRFIYIISPILFAVFGVVVVKCNLIEVLIFWLPMYLLNDASIKLLSKNIRSTKWTNIYETILFPALMMSVILETFGISENKFSVTKKDGIDDDRKFRIRKSIPHIILSVLSAIGIMNCIRMIFASGSPTYSVVLFWLISNFYNSLMAVFFMLGRKTYRKTERFSAQVNCDISYNDNTIVSKTVDISETGIAFLLDKPQFIPYDETINVSLDAERYNTQFTGKIVHVDKINNGWKYAVRLEQIGEGKYKQLLNIIYDREPCLPLNLDESNSIFDDLRVNILTRSKRIILFNRRLPRINLAKIVDSKECGHVKVVCFNYEYIEIETTSEGNSNVMTINISESITIKCILIKKLQSEHNVSNRKNKKYLNGAVTMLYSIQNYKEVANNKDFNNILSSWIDEYNCQNIKSNKGMKSSDEINEMEHL